MSVLSLVPSLRQTTGLTVVMASLLGYGAASAQVLGPVQGPIAAPAPATPPPPAPAGTGVAGGTAPSAAAPAQPSTDAMVNLIRLLVAQGTISKANGDALLAQASAEAAEARARLAAAIPPPPPAPPPLPEGGVRVTHIPAVVRQAIKDELRQEVLQQASAEGWTKGETVPEWTKRIRIFGDMRLRSDSELYSKTNARDIIDFASINASGPYDFATHVGNGTLPYLDSRADRVNRINFRARLGFTADITPGVSATIQLASGNNNGPVSTNAALGGGFGKKQVWLDLANITVRPTEDTALLLGRFPNPFNPDPMLYYPDMRMDGAAVQVADKHLLGDNSLAQLTLGAFPLDQGPQSFPADSQNKQGFPSKYLFAGEVRLKGNVDSKLQLDVSAGLHKFLHLHGRPSDACNLDFVVVCSTDGYAPVSLQSGNTLFFMRNLTANSTTSAAQVLGLKFDYDVLNLQVGARVPVNDKVAARVWGIFDDNLGWRRADICNHLSGTASLGREPINNVSGSGYVCQGTATYSGGHFAYTGGVRIGHDTIAAKGSWFAQVEYRYIESDAVVDAFNDSDFHLGGTNTKGFVLRGEYSLRDYLSAGFRFTSANQIAGDAFSIDSLLVETTARF